MFNAVDPRGYSIVCSDDTISHIECHKVMENNHAAIEQTITNPDAIFKSAERDDRDVYFAKPSCATYSKHNLYTKVVVQLDESSMVGEVVTAFPSPGIKGNISEGGIVYVKPRL